MTMLSGGAGDATTPVVCKSVRDRPFLFPTEAACEEAGKKGKSFFAFIGRHAEYTCESMETGLS